MRHTGHDSHGRPVALGGTDTDGYPVGYIDGEGLCWEDRVERDRAVGGGRLIDAWRDWASCGGLVTYPDPEAVLRRHDVLPENYDAAIEEATSSIELMHVTCPDGGERGRRAAQAARWN